MGNLFAFRATQPKDLMMSSNPIGDDNDYWLEQLSKDAGIVIAGWGNHGVFLNRSAEVLIKLPEICCLKINKSGQPSHPLYLKKGLDPIPFPEGKSLSSLIIDQSAISHSLRLSHAALPGLS